MVTLIKYGALSGGEKYNVNVLNLDGLSTDTKPIGTFIECGVDGREIGRVGIPNGSLYTEIDSGDTYMYDSTGSQWHKVSLGGGGGGDGTIDTQVNGTSANAVQNKAIYNFTNSSIATNTAYYVSNNGQPFTSVAQLEAYTGEVSNNDYAFVRGTDLSGNTYYDRYKATVVDDVVTWAKEYRLNNSSFTSNQWETINSGFTASDKTAFDNLAVVLTQTEYDALVTKTARFYCIIEEAD